MKCPTCGENCLRDSYDVHPPSFGPWRCVVCNKEIMMTKKKAPLEDVLTSLGAQRKEQAKKAADLAEQKKALLQNRSNPSSPHPDELNAMLVKIDADIHDIVNNVIAAIDAEIAAIESELE